MNFRFRHAVYSIAILSFIAIVFEAAPILVVAAANAPTTITGKLDKLGLSYVLDAKGKTATFLAPGSKPLTLKKKQTSIANIGTQFFKDYGTYFGITKPASQLKLLGTSADVTGLTHARYVQTLNGVPVFGGEIVLNVKANKDIAFATGKFFQGLSVKTTPTLTKAKVDAIAIKHLKNVTGKNSSVVERNLYVLQPNLLDPSISSPTRLAYEEVLAGPDGRDVVYVDALSGAVIWRGTDTKTLTRTVYDCRSDGGCDDGTTIHWSTVGRAEGAAATGDASIDGVYDVLGGASDYFWNTFHLNGADGAGGLDGAATPALAYFSPTSSHGFCPNAYSYTTQLAFCDGVVNPAVVGHEYGHSVNHLQALSWPLYRGETGAIDEALADVWGQAVARDMTGSSSWTIGPNAAARPWRDLSDPSSLGAPVTFYDSHFYCTSTYAESNDWGGMHQNSNVISHIDYLLSNGGDLMGCTIPAIGQDRAERLFFASLRSVTRTTSFRDFASILTGTCDAIYGAGTADCAAVRTAVQASEIDQFGPCSRVAGMHFNERIPACRLQVIEPPPVINPNSLPNTSTSTSPEQPPVTLPPEVNQPPAIPTSTSDEKPPTDKTTPTGDTTVTEDRTPVYDVDVNVNGSTAHVEIKVVSFGKGGTNGECALPRYFDPVFVRWDDGSETLKPDSQNADTYEFSHLYDKYVDHPIVIETVVTDECFGHVTKQFPVDVVLPPK